MDQSYTHFPRTHPSLGLTKKIEESDLSSPITHQLSLSIPIESLTRPTMVPNKQYGIIPSPSKKLLMDSIINMYIAHSQYTNNK
jgi:hypothetical protein